MTRASDAALVTEARQSANPHRLTFDQIVAQPPLFVPFESFKNFRAQISPDTPDSNIRSISVSQWRDVVGLLSRLAGRRTGLYGQNRQTVVDEPVQPSLIDVSIVGKDGWKYQLEGLQVPGAAILDGEDARGSVDEPVILQRDRLRRQLAREGGEFTGYECTQSLQVQADWTRRKPEDLLVNIIAVQALIVARPRSAVDTSELKRRSQRLGYQGVRVWGDFVGHTLYELSA